MYRKSSTFDIAVGNVPLINLRWEFRAHYEVAHAPDFLYQSDGRVMPILTPYLHWVGMPGAGATLLIVRAISGIESYMCAAVRDRQIDLFIYDRAASAPIATGEENLLLPCETVYAVIEVKSRLTQDELDSAYLNAASVRKLRPFKKQFVGARTDGEASDGSSRCMYFLFAFDTNLSEDQWLSKEHSRMTSAAVSANVDPDAIDRIIVLGRGIIAPPQRSGRVVVASDREGVFFEFYVHLMNFLNRERSRRPPVDWQVYAPRTVPGWQHL